MLIAITIIAIQPDRHSPVDSIRRALSWMNSPYAYDLPLSPRPPPTFYKSP